MVSQLLSSSAFLIVSIKLKDDMIAMMDTYKVYEEMAASNKDENKPWGRFFDGLYNKERGIARDFQIPQSSDRVGNLKSKIVNQFWPAMKNHIETKLKKKEAVTQAELDCLRHMQTYETINSYNEKAKKEEKEKRERVQAGMELIEDSFFVGPPSGSISDLNFHGESQYQSRSQSPQDSAPGKQSATKNVRLPLGHSSSQSPFDAVTQRLVSMLESMPIIPSTREQGCDENSSRNERKRLLEELEQRQLAAHKVGDNERKQLYAKRIKKLEDEIYGMLDDE